MGKPPARSPGKTTAAPKSPPDDRLGVSGDTEHLAEEVTRRVINIVGKDKAGLVAAQVVSIVSERFAGPIAHPRHLREYEDISPGAADRIIAMAERQLDHSMEMDRELVRGQIKDIRHGRYFGFAALISLIAGAILAGYWENNVLAGLLLGTGALGTVAVLTKGKLWGS